MASSLREEKSTKPFVSSGRRDVNNHGSSSRTGGILEGSRHDDVNKSSASKPTPIDVVSARLNQMSIEERSDALYDLHGVADDIEETPEFLDSKHNELASALLSSVTSVKPEESYALRTALRLSKEYVEGLKLRFLRADLYQCELAANRMIKFFSRKLELFGEDLLVQDIKLKHLTDEEKEPLHNGVIQLLNQQDRAGRVIFLIDGRVNVMYPDTRGVMRAIFYFAMAAMQDEEIQRKRLVAIYYGVGQKKIIKGRIVEYYKHEIALPWGAVGFHYCKDNNVLTPAVNFLCKTFENKVLCRARFHSGSHLECVYNLMTFGIPREAIPLSDDGTSDLSYHRGMMDALRAREERQELAKSKVVETPEVTPAKSTLVPAPMDIIMGRGRRPKSQLGAMRMHNLLLKYRDAYDAGAKFDKTIVSESIVNELKSMGCRFLMPTTGGYVECDNAAARAKVSHGFRNLRVKMKDDSNQQEEMKAKKRNLVESS